MIIPARYGEIITKEAYPPDREGNFVHLPFEGEDGSYVYDSITPVKLDASTTGTSYALSSTQKRTGSTSLYCGVGQRILYFQNPNKIFSALSLSFDVRVDTAAVEASLLYYHRTLANGSSSSIQIVQTSTGNVQIAYIGADSTRTIKNGAPKEEWYNIRHLISSTSIESYYNGDWMRTLTHGTVTANEPALNYFIIGGNVPYYIDNLKIKGLTMF